nr:hypothetical protein [Clostridium botulinum]
MLAYIFIIIDFFNTGFSFKGWIRFGVVFLATLIYGVITKDLYWCILVLFICCAKKNNQKKILYISMFILVSGILCVLFLCFVGLLPDVLTARDDSIMDSFNRHSLGFYHSNVLPLIIFYLEAYYVFLKKEKIKYLTVIFFVFTSIILKVICNSRNAFYLCLVLSLLVIIQKRFGFGERIQRILYRITKYSVFVMSLFSYLMMFLLLHGGIWNTIDSFFSGRFRLAIFKMRHVGLHLVNFMSNEDFTSDSVTYVNGRVLENIVLDNGYIYVLLRYGVLFILFYVFISFTLAKKSKENMYELCVLLVVVVANFIDNDLADYSFLPFILFAFSNIYISDTIRKIKKQVS